MGFAGGGGGGGRGGGRGGGGEGEGNEEGVGALVTFVVAVVLGEEGVVGIIVVGAVVLVGASVRVTASVLEAMVAVIEVGSLGLGSWWHCL